MPTDFLKNGREALARGAWEEARAHFEESLRQQETPEALEDLAWATTWLNDAAATIAAREQAYRLYKERGEVRSAARVAGWLVLDYIEFRGDAAIAGGWLQRAKRLLENLEPAYEHGQLMIIEGNGALLGNKDTATAKKFGAEAAALGRKINAIDVEMLGLALEGLAKVSEGEVEAGMRLLDEATTAATAGESKDLNAIGTTCCFLINACERVRDYDRAAQWCKRVEEFSRKWRMGSLFAICRTQYASILMWRGNWAEAENELLTAQREIAHYRPDLVKACTVRLAELRRRQGRWEEAAKLFAHVESHILSLLGRAALALDQDEAPQSGVDFAERYLRRIPAADRTERVAGLELLVRAQVALGKMKEATTALAELQAISAMVATEPLRAAAKFAEGIFAAETEDWETARHCFEDAADLFERMQTPFELGRSRLALARIFFALEQNQRAETEARAALAVLQQIGASQEAERAEALGREIKSARAMEERLEHAAEPEVLTRREKEILQLVATGQSNEELAAKLFLSVRTVERHLVNIYTKLGFSGKSARAAAAAYAVRQERPRQKNP